MILCVNKKKKKRQTGSRIYERLYSVQKKITVCHGRHNLNNAEQNILRSPSCFEAKALKSL